MSVPGYDSRPGLIPPYDVKSDPLYRPDREYGPGHPFVSATHEAWEARRLAQQKVETWIATEAAAALKQGHGRGL